MGPSRLPLGPAAALAGALADDEKIRDVPGKWGTLPTLGVLRCTLPGRRGAAPVVGAAIPEDFHRHFRRGPLELVEPAQGPSPHDQLDRWCGGRSTHVSSLPAFSAILSGTKSAGFRGSGSLTAGRSDANRRHLLSVLRKTKTLARNGFPDYRPADLRGFECSRGTAHWNAICHRIPRARDVQHCPLPLGPFPLKDAPLLPAGRFRRLPPLVGIR